MDELLFLQLEKQIHLGTAEREAIKRHFHPRKLKKKQFLLREGDICRQMAFVEKGALFSYSTDPKGSQHVIQFAFEGWWIADLLSYFTNEPSKLYIEVLEDCYLLLLDRENQEELMKEVPAFETYCRILYQNAYVALQQRIESTIGLSAEERYTHLIGNNTFILSRVPQHLVASYLGITPETLSRIRKQMAQNS